MSFRVTAVVILAFSILVGCSQAPTAPVATASTTIVDVTSIADELRMDGAAGTVETFPSVRFSRLPRQPNVTEVEFYDASLALLAGVPLSVTLGVRGSAGVEYGDVKRSGPSRYRVQVAGHFIDDWQGETVSIRIMYGDAGGKPVRSSSFDVFVLKSGVAPLQAPRLTDLRVIKDGSKGFPSIIRVTVNDDPAGRVASVKLEVTAINGSTPPPTVETLPLPNGDRSFGHYQWRVSSTDDALGAVYRLKVTMFDVDGMPVGTSLIEATDLMGSSDRWLASLNGRLVFDEKQGWSLVISAVPRKGLGKFVEKVTGKITGVADAVAPKPDLFELKALGNDAAGRQVYRSPGLEFTKDPRGSIFRVNLEFTLSQPSGGGTRVRYGQCWVFAAL